MKRYLLLFCTVVLIGALIAVPSLAAELQIYEAQIVDGAGDFPSRIAPGTYIVTLTIDGQQLQVDNNELIVTVDTPSYYEFFFWVEGRRYSLRIRLMDDEAYVEFMDADEIQVQGSVGLCRVAPPPALDPDSDDPKPLPGSIVGSIGGVFGQVGSWITSQIGAVSGLFWSSSSGSLTFLGVLAVAAIGIAVVLLLINVIRGFLHFG